MDFIEQTEASITVSRSKLYLLSNYKSYETLLPNVENSIKTSNLAFEKVRDIDFLQI